MAVVHFQLSAATLLVFPSAVSHSVRWKRKSASAPETSPSARIDNLGRHLGARVGASCSLFEFRIFAGKTTSGSVDGWWAVVNRRKKCQVLNLSYTGTRALAFFSFAHPAPRESHSVKRKGKNKAKNITTTYLPLMFSGMCLNLRAHTYTAAQRHLAWNTRVTETPSTDPT